MKIAIMGIRGIPANYGGFETFAEALAPRLVENGNQVTVYGRSNIIDYNEEYYKGVQLRIFPTISHKYFDTVTHTGICVLDSIFQDFDVILICNSANSVFAWVPRLFGHKVVINVDGLEWQRKKWNKLGQWFYRVSEFLATIFSDRIVTDARWIKKYYQKKFKTDSDYIPYGTPTQKAKTKLILNEFGVDADQYILYVSRLEPENNAHLVVKAFEKVKTDMKLVVVGDAPYNKEYIDKLKSTKDQRIIFTGYVFGGGYQEFQSHAYCYVQATEVGGTHPALVEAMGFGNCIVANDVPEHREVLQDTGIFFSTKKDDDLVNKIQTLVDDPKIVHEYRRKAMDRVQKNFTWEKVTKDYESLFHNVTRNGKK